MKYPKKLGKRVWAEELPRHALFVDTETSEDSEGVLSLLLGCYELWQVSKRGKRVRMLNHGVFDTIEDFHRVMRKSASCRVIAHNFNFDASVLRIASAANRQAFGYTLDFGSSIMPAEVSAYSPFLLRLGYDNDTYAELIDNTNFYKMSLSAIGDSLRIPKLDMPETTERESMIAYCYRDVEILREAYFRLFSFVNTFGTTPSITTASAAMRVFQKRFYERKQVVQGSQHIPAVNKAERLAYHGGRTDVFWKGIPDTDRPIYKYDVNSLYPSCMLGDIPIRYAQSVDGNFDSKAYNKLYGEDNRIGLYDVTLDINPSSKYGFLGLEGVFTEDAGLVFGAGKFRCWLWQPLYEIAVKQGYITDTHKIYLYDSESLFKSYIENLYSLRQKYKRQQNTAYDMLCKLFMNSLYGKFGQRAYGGWKLIDNDIEREAMMWDSVDDGITRFAGYFGDDAEANYLQLGDLLWKYDDSEIGNLSDRAVCSVAGYITAMGRAKVWQAMATILDLGGNIYMCDTDSVVCDVRLPASMVSDTELGKWALEGISKPEECDFTAPKHYIYKGQIKLKGVRNPVIGNTVHRQARFPRFMTDLASKNPKRQANLEIGGRMLYIDSTPTGENRKRIEQGMGLPTLPIVI